MTELEILYEDNHLIAINKRAGDIVQGDKTGDEPLSDKVKSYIKDTYNKPGNVYLGTTHRIDRPVSGVVIFAKTSKALTRLNKLFQEKEVNKTYWAVVGNRPEHPSGKLSHFLIKNQEKNKSRAYTHEVKNGKKAVLNYKLLMDFDRYYLLEIKPETGRHHQIRVQLSAMGCPIKGDVKYGFDRTNKDASIHLHALRLELIHPVTKEKISIQANPPEDPIWNDCRHLIN